MINIIVFSVMAGLRDTLPSVRGTCPNGVNNTGSCCLAHSGPFIIGKNGTVIGITSDTNGCGIFN